MGDPVPLRQTGKELPPTGTLFQQAQTVVYYSQEEDVQLDQRILDYLKAISKKIADQKTLVVGVTWHSFLKQVSVKISEYFKASILYNTPEDFFAEHTPYRQASSKSLQSNKIKKAIHSILTYAIFHLRPSKDLYDEVPDKIKPDPELWSGDSNKWLSLSAEPFSAVSIIQFQTISYCDINLLNLCTLFCRNWIKIPTVQIAQL